MDDAVKWSPLAIEDLESIAEYIERDSAFYAKAVVSKFLDTARSLVEFPQIGRIVPELGIENIRERFVYSYRLIYQINDHDILIVAIIHGRRLFAGIDERFI